MEVEHRCAIVTGASSGIGEEFARQLAPRTRRLILVARRRERLENLRTQLLMMNPLLEIDVRALDLSLDEHVGELTASLEQETVDLLINNAGLGDYGRVASADPIRLRQMIAVNVLALTQLTRAVLPRMIAQKRGAILHVSSSAGFLPLPGFAVYAGTKAYVTSFSEAVRAEVAGSGVLVSALCPGPVETEFDVVASRGDDRSGAGPKLARVPVDRVVKAGLDGLWRNQPIIIPGVFMKMGMTLARLTPMPLLRWSWQFWRR